MTPKQLRFVQEYLIDLNATQSAIRAGYSPRTAEQIGHQLLKKTSVAEAIAAARAKVAAKLDLTLEGVLQDINDIADEARAAEEFSPALTGKIALGKHLGMGLGVQKNQAVDEKGQPMSLDELARRSAFLFVAAKRGEKQPDPPALH